MRENPPIRSLEEYEKQHRQQHERLWAYICKANGMKKYSPELIEEMKAACPTSLFSTNLEARLTFARCANDAFRSARIRAPNGFFKLTLALREYATPLERAHEFDCEPLKNWVKDLLSGKSHFGMVDAALYTKITPEERYRRPIVSWHTHDLVWGCKERELQVIVKAVNDGHESLVRGLPPADVSEPMNLAQMLSDLWYDLKAPLKEYRVRRTPQKEIEQKKRAMRGGHLLAMSNAFLGRTIPSLMIAGGDGVRLLDEVISNTCGELEATERQRLQELDRKMAGRQVAIG